MFHYIILLALVVSTVLAGGPSGHFAKCIAETGANPKMFDEPPSADAVPDEKTKCFHACIMKSLGAMGDDGTINKVIGNLPANMRDKERVTLAIKECGAKIKAGTNACDAAYEIFKCTLGKLPNLPHYGPQ